VFRYGIYYGDGEEIKKRGAKVASFKGAHNSALSNRQIIDLYGTGEGRSWGNAKDGQVGGMGKRRLDVTKRGGEIFSGCRTSTEMEG